MMRVTAIAVLWVMGFITTLLLIGIVMGCSVPRSGYVLDSKTGKYSVVSCETYSRTPVQRAILLSEVQP